MRSMARQCGALGGAGLVLLASACTAEPVRAPEVQEPEIVQLKGRALGTTWQVSWRPVVTAEPERVQAQITQVLAEVDQAMSTWREDTELSVARRSEEPVEISESTARVVREALDLAAMTRGAFDPTVQPLMELWGFHGRPVEQVPRPAEIEEVLEQVGWERVVLDRASSGRPVLDVGGTALDLSAIAKGYAVDRVFHALAALGAGSIFVEVGGEVRVGGPGVAGPLWRVGVSLPEAGSAVEELALVVQLTNGAVATSGNYRNQVVIDGVPYAHTMDPRIGAPVDSGVASATVFAPDCMTADAWATALMVLGAEEGLELVERLPDVEAALLLPHGERFRLVLSSGLRPPGSSAVEIVSRRVDAAAD